MTDPALSAFIAQVQRVQSEQGWSDQETIQWLRNAQEYLKQYGLPE